MSKKHNQGKEKKLTLPHQQVQSAPSGQEEKEGINEVVERKVVDILHKYDHKGIVIRFLAISTLLSLLMGGVSATYQVIEPLFSGEDNVATTSDTLDTINALNKRIHELETQNQKLKDQQTANTCSLKPHTK